MSKTIRATFLGTGATLYLGLGGVPRFVRLTNPQSVGDTQIITWTPDHAALAAAKGGVAWGSGGASTFAAAVLTPANGIAPYIGGDAITSASTAYQQLVSGETGIDPASPLGDTSLGGDLRARGGTAITKWTLGNSTNFTGNFDQVLNTTLCGVGSMVEIEDYTTRAIQRAYITALTSTGAAANQVTLDRAISGGWVRFIGYKYGFGAVPAGYTMQAGIIVKDTSLVNAASEIVLLEAEIE